MSRFIGIVHRVKATKKGEERPTLVAIREGDQVATWKLKREVDELDFLLGRYPTSVRKFRKGDKVERFAPHHVIYRQNPKTKLQEPFEVPATYEGVRAGDTLAMMHGGSGDRLAFALSRRGEEIGAELLRIPTIRLKPRRNGGQDRDADAILLTNLVETHRSEFYPVTEYDRRIIRISELDKERDAAQYARKACEQRLWDQFIGEVFLSPEGRYPDGEIKAAFKKARANDEKLKTLERVEAEASKALEKAVLELDLWHEVFAKYDKVGYVTAAKLIAAIGDVRRFTVPGEEPTPERPSKWRTSLKLSQANLRHFLGAHVMAGGNYADVDPDKSFPRKRRGQIANWDKRGRQALYNIVEVWNKSPDSEGGRKLRELKARFREKHPEVITVRVPDPDQPGKKKTVKRYSDGHVHRMGSWRTASWFVNRIYVDWTRAIREGRVRVEQ